MSVAAQVARYSLVLLFGLLAATARADLQQDVESILREEGFAGATWMLLTPQQGLITGAAGYQDFPTHRPMQVTNRVHVGSVTKSVLATGILRLASRGVVDLDAPARNYLPVELTRDVAGINEVTVRHLLDHTAGLDDARLWQMFSERPTPDTPLEQAFPEPVELLRLRSAPGTRFSYSNMGFALLGMVIEQVTGARYETFLDQNLLQPLGMLDSTFAFTTQEGPTADPMLAWGHIDDGSRYAAAPIFLRPAGQFTTTAADLGRFAQFLLSDGRIDGAAFIDESLMRARGVVGHTEAALAGLDAGYALGLGRRDRHGVVGYCHGGNIVGYAAMLCIYPGAQKAFAYSVNTDREGARYSRIEARLVRALQLEGAAEPATAVEDCLACRAGVYAPAPNRFASFRYLDRLFAAQWVSVAGSELLAKPPLGSARALRPVGGGLFSSPDRMTASHVFYSDAVGGQSMSTGFQTYQREPVYLQFLLWSNLGLGLVGLVWVCLRGTLLVFRGPARLPVHPLGPVYFVLLGFSLPVALFFRQSFIALGDLTPASAALAALTAAVPAAAAMGLFSLSRHRPRSRSAWLDTAALFAVLQWSVVLAWYGLLPLRLWA